MPVNNIGKHHLYTRKHIYEHVEKYPHEDPLKALIDKIVYFAGIAGVIMTIPQIWLIYVQKTAEGLSILSWVSYWVIGMVWLLYGFIHKEKPIIVINILWFFLHLSIIAGILMYG